MKANSEKYEVVAEINMIPFIDVSLVLLIIFMVMTPFLVKEQIKISLPKTRAVNSQVDTHKLIQINISRAGAIYVDGEAVGEDQVFAAVKRHLVDPETQPVVIAADKDVAFEKVVVAMDAAKRCGAKQLGVSVKHDDGAAADKDASATPPKHTTDRTRPRR